MRTCFKTGHTGQCTHMWTRSETGYIPDPLGYIPDPLGNGPSVPTGSRTWGIHILCGPALKRAAYQFVETGLQPALIVRGMGIRFETEFKPQGISGLQPVAYWFPDFDRVRSAFNRLRTDFPTSFGSIGPPGPQMMLRANFLREGSFRITTLGHGDMVSRPELMLWKEVRY